MENGPSTFGLEDGTIDVEGLLVEPQDEHPSVDSVICFNKKIPENAMDIKDVSCSFGRSATDIAQGGEDVINGEVLDATPGDDEVGYFRYHNDFCNMGEDYLLGYEFSESITNLDYGPNESLEASIPDNKMEASSAAGSDTTCKSDIFRLPNEPNFQDDQFNFESNELSKISSSHEQEILIEEKPSISSRSRSLQNHENSSPPFQDILSDENDGRLSEKDDGFLQGQDASTIVSVQDSCGDVLPTQKRSRKPTQRYIDELTDPIPAYSKKRREVTASTRNRVRKPLGIKDKKKCDMGSKAISLVPAEESSVPAIQVPFASEVHKECPETHAYDVVQHVDSGNLVTKTKGKCLNRENKRKRDCMAIVHIKRRDEGAAIAKLPAAPHLKEKDICIAAKSLKKRKDLSIALISKKKDEHFTAAHQKKSDDCLTAESPEEVNGKRKHHRLWTIAEVRKLIDGVSQYGVGRWSRIKKLFFSTSTHRTSVDLKDKWRNLLKASGIQEQVNREGEKKRNMAWRPLPKSILRRVCELASMHPYPKGQRLKIAHDISDDSPDRAADITLSDYRKILRSINGD